MAGQRERQKTSQGTELADLNICRQPDRLIEETAAGTISANQIDGTGVRFSGNR
ncbi:hypothetical protein BgiBS90_008547, partial [Biomphalaria glabrata]